MCHTEYVNTVSTCSLITIPSHSSPKHDSFGRSNLLNYETTSWWTTLSTDRWNSELS